MSNKELVKEALTRVLGQDIGELSVINEYFSQDYIQIVDGKTIDFNGFVEHMRVLKEATKDISIVIKSIAEGENSVHTQHIARAVKNDDTVSEYEVFACFQIINGKITRCEELTRMLSGSTSDEDLGSRT